MQRPQDLIFVIKSGNFPWYLPVVSNSRREEVVQGTKGTIERDNLESEKSLVSPRSIFLIGYYCCDARRNQSLLMEKC